MLPFSSSVDLQLDFLDAVFGCSRELDVDRLTGCEVGQRGWGVGQRGRESGAGREAGAKWAGQGWIAQGSHNQAWGTQGQEVLAGVHALLCALGPAAVLCRFAGLHHHSSNQWRHSLIPRVL